MIYVAYYTRENDDRVNSPAANPKILSISRALAENDQKVNIICSNSNSHKIGFIKGEKFSISKNIKCLQFGFISSKFKKINALTYYLCNIRLILYLILNAKTNEYVIFYHSIERINPVLFAKKIKKFKLLLEVEEIYSNVANLSEEKKKLEYKIINNADAFIFSTKMLNSVNKHNKPFVVINGTYETEDIKKVSFNDKKIHIVYAGNLDPKKGALITIDSGKYLDDNYCIHILGETSEENMKIIKNHIDSVNKENKASVKYEGFKSNVELTEFYQKCHIGSAAQNTNEIYNNCSFPSKILTYMANGLRVVTIRVPAIETSSVGQYMYYYNSNNPKELADAIKLVDLNKEYDSRKILNELKTQFIKDIGNIVNK